MKIVKDLFPCHVVAVAADIFEDPRVITSYQPSPEGTYVGKTRVVLTDEAIVIAADSATGPVVVFQERYVEYFAAKKDTEDSHIITKSGKMIAFKKDTSCGCGSRLRSWHAYNTLTALGY
jgi:hypothetical protein